jgi:hypothetical protein
LLCQPFQGFRAKTSLTMHTMMVLKIPLVLRKSEIIPRKL